jgi:hypothetical protein
VNIRSGDSYPAKGIFCQALRNPFLDGAFQGVEVRSWTFTLGEIDGFFTAGEIRFLWERILQARHCGCGARFVDCPIWSGIIKEGSGEQVPEQWAETVNQSQRDSARLSTRFGWSGRRPDALLPVSTLGSSSRPWNGVQDHGPFYWSAGDRRFVKATVERCTPSFDEECRSIHRPTCP